MREQWCADIYDAAREEEYLRFDVLGDVLHCHFILNAENRNVLVL